MVPKALFGALLLLCLSKSLVAQSDPASKTLLLDLARQGQQIFAVGERGVILVSKDEAKSWQRVSAPCLATITGIAFAPDGNSAWAVGHAGTILCSKDGGKTWTQAQSKEDKEAIFLDVIAPSANEVIAVGAFGKALASWDGGKTWENIKPAAEDQHLNRISKLADGSLLIVGERGFIARSTDGGHQWTLIPSPYEGSFFGIQNLEGKEFLLFGLRGNLYRGNLDTLPQLEKIETGGKFLLATGVKLKNGRIILAGQARVTLLSSDGSKTFARWNSGLTTAVAELLETNDGSVLAVGEAGVSLLKAP